MNACGFAQYTSAKENSSQVRSTKAKTKILLVTVQFPDSLWILRTSLLHINTTSYKVTIKEMTNRLRQAQP